MTAPPPHGRPNVLLFMVDQQRYDACGCCGSEVCRTPHLDRLAAQGMRFDNAYATVPLCSPTRAAFWSGLLPNHNGVLVNTHWGNPVTPQSARLGADIPLLSELLQADGYRTAHFGKWHVGPDTEPRVRGFDHAVARSDFEQRAGAPREPPRRHIEVARDYIVADYPFAGITTADDEDFFEIWLCRRAEEWMRRQVGTQRLGAAGADADADAPFFCCVSTPGPHPGYIVPERYAAYEPAAMQLWPNLHDDLSDKPAVHRLFRDVVTHSGSLSDDEWRICIARYYAFVTLIDEQLGRMLDLLDELNATDNTIVMFVSDHGDLLGAHRLWDKGPMMYDEQLHLPLVIRWPQVVAPATSADAMLSFIDLMPTLADATGVRLPHAVDGRSVLPLLTGEPLRDWPDDVYVQYHGEGIALYSMRAVRTRRYKYVYYPYDRDELYDLQRDPWELHNLADDPKAATVLSDMRRRLARWLDQTGDVMVHWNAGITKPAPRS